VSEPSPAVLRAYAEELRELARAQDGRAASCATLLDSVTRLDDDDTWQGTYPAEARLTLQSWVTGLAQAAKTCREDAASWRARAADLEHRADTAPTGR
jgi:hypothetical protein